MKGVLDKTQTRHVDYKIGTLQGSKMKQNVLQKKKLRKSLKSRLEPPEIFKSRQGKDS
jgi:hypothetical protein